MERLSSSGSHFDLTSRLGLTEVPQETEPELEADATTTDDANQGLQPGSWWKMCTRSDPQGLIPLGSGNVRPWLGANCSNIGCLSALNSPHLNLHTSARATRYARISLSSPSHPPRLHLVTVRHAGRALPRRRSRPRPAEHLHRQLVSGVSTTPSPSPSAPPSAPNRTLDS